ERLATHDTALRAAGTARAQIYHRLAHGPASAAVRLHSGELVARVGADVDDLADVLVRALVPIGVAAVLALAATLAGWGSFRCRPPQYWRSAWSWPVLWRPGLPAGLPQPRKRLPGNIIRSGTRPQ